METREWELEWTDRQTITFLSTNTQTYLTYQVILNQISNIPNQIFGRSGLLEIFKVLLLLLHKTV